MDATERSVGPRDRSKCPSFQLWGQTPNLSTYNRAFSGRSIGITNVNKALGAAPSISTPRLANVPIGPPKGPARTGDPTELASQIADQMAASIPK